MKEKAVIIENINKNNFKYKVAYLGSFFCINLLPSLKDIDILYKKKQVTIMTPYMTQEEISKCKINLSKILYNYDDIEILINDFGLLEYLNKKYPKIKKGIGLPLSYDIVRMKAEKINKFMEKYKLDILDTDEDGFLYNFKRRDFKISFHYPLKFVGSSRFCPYTRSIIPKKCEFKCKEQKVITLSHPNSNKNIYSYHTAYFILKDEISNNNFDRLTINYENDNKG